MNDAICPGCHSGDYADFDHFCDARNIQPGEEGPAFAAWLHLRSGGAWDGDCGRVEP